jgi:FkbM family methyltransferase
MKPPFSTTLKQAGTVGLPRTIFAVIVLSIRILSQHLRHMPEYAIVEVNKSKMILFPPKKGGIQLDLFLHKKREPICSQYLAKNNLIKDGDIVLDVGANIGYYVLIESKLVGDQGRVYAIEPVLGNFSLLAKTIQLNCITNVSAYQLAFGDQNGKGEIYVSKQSNLCRMKKYTAKDIVDTQEVHVETVDAFLRGKKVPKLIRMDVEGYEYEIIKGMTETLKQDVMLVVELHPRYLSKRMYDLFEIMDQNHYRVRFAVFEDKVEENVIMRSLVNKARGYKLPICISHASIAELRHITAKNPEYAFNVFFEK